MSSSVLESPKKLDRYHHGDLKNALLDAARDLATEGSVDGFTLREVARRAGVSPAAPYHHFADKNDLVRQLAIRAFDTMRQTLQTAADSAIDTNQQLEAMGAAYLHFAFAHAAEFRFMFKRELCAPPGQPDPLEVAGRAAQSVLHSVVVAAQANQTLRAGDPQSIVLTIWSAIHGLSGILLETPSGKNATLEVAEAMARSVIANVLSGVR
jgi:AcrR family transcriptional regulator